MKSSVVSSKAHRVVILAAALALACPAQATAQSSDKVALPEPEIEGEMSLESAIAKRRSRRRYSKRDLSRVQVSQLLWSAQGITGAKEYRAAPSAGARYPLTLYVLRPTGMFRYLPRGHRLEKVRADDVRAALWEHVYARPWLADSPAIFLIAADYQKTRKKYGAKADRFVHMEAGHAGQNLLLQATALGLHAVGIGAFHDRRAARTVELPRNETLLYVITVGHPPS